MNLVEAMTRGLSRADASEFAVASGRLPSVKISGAYHPVGEPPASTQEILEMLVALGGIRYVDRLGKSPLTWKAEDERLGAIVVTAVRRDELVQARFVIHRTTEGVDDSHPSSGVMRVVPEIEVAREGGDFDILLYDARHKCASDLHLVAGRPPLFRVAGELAATGRPLDPAALERMLLAQIPPRLLSTFEKDGSADFAIEHRSAGRFRANVSRQRTGLKASLRLIGARIPTLESLGLPASIEKATRHHQGLIVVTGPTGHGKTSTLAALVDVLNLGTTHHIITVEDPIEYVHPRKKAMISQREVGSHTRSFAAALKGSLREDPDVIVVGELRDTETVRMALAASETGHLVIGTMNTPSASKTIDRLIDLFPPGDQPQVRMTLAGGLRLIVSQRLLRGADGKSVHAAAEILPGSVALWSLIRDDKTYQIPSLQQRGKSLGIVRLDDSLAELVRAGKVKMEDARTYAESPDDFEAAVRVIGKRG